MKIKLFEEFNEEEINNMLDNFNDENKDILANKSRAIEGNIVDEFYKALGDRKFVAYEEKADDPKFSKVLVKYDPLLFNMIFLANDIDYCYYSPEFKTEDIVLFTLNTKNKVEKFNSLSLEKQVHSLTFDGGGFKKQKRKK